MADLRGPVMVRCAACGDAITLDRRVPVAAAEIAVFIETHASHEQMRIDVTIQAEEEPGEAEPE